jgi:hypothetical protein
LIQEHSIPASQGRIGQDIELGMISQRAWNKKPRRSGAKSGFNGASVYRSRRSPDWLKMKNPNAPAVKREAEEDWSR